MIEDPTVVHSFAAVGGASTLFVISQMARGALRFISTKRADAAQEQRNAAAELQDLKEAVERLKALVPPQAPPVQMPPVTPPQASLPWAPTGSVPATSHG